MEAKEKTFDPGRVIATFSKNSRGEEVRVAIRNFNNHELLDVRLWYPSETDYAPGKGLSLPLSKLDDLRSALDQVAAEVGGAA